MSARRSSTRIAATSTAAEGSPQGKRKSQTTPISHKRNLSSNSTIQISASEVKRAKRTASAKSATKLKASPKKSQYFGEVKLAEESPLSTSPSEEDHNEDVESSYEELSEISLPSASADGDDGASESSFDDRSKKGKQKKSKNIRKPPPKGVIASTIDQGKELWRQGVSAGLGPGREVFIAKPKPRAEGAVKYAADKIHSNTFEFLADLKASNDREWLKMHDPDYRASKHDWDTFVECLTEKLIESDDTIPELPPKDLVIAHI